MVLESSDTELMDLEVSFDVYSKKCAEYDLTRKLNLKEVGLEPVKVHIENIAIHEANDFKNRQNIIRAIEAIEGLTLERVSNIKCDILGISILSPSSTVKSQAAEAKTFESWSHNKFRDSGAMLPGSNKIYEEWESESKAGNKSAEKRAEDAANLFEKITGFEVDRFHAFLMEREAPGTDAKRYA